MKLDLDALQAAAEAATPGDGQHIYTDQRDDNNWKANEAWHLACSPAVILAIIDRLRKAEAQHADLLKSMFEIAWMNDSQRQTHAAKQACLRNPELSYPAAHDSTPTDSAGAEK